MQRETNPSSKSFAHGFTLIEVLMVIFIVEVMLILGGVSWSLLSRGWSSSWDRGHAETRCISGYKFVIGEGGQARQVQDEFGKGVRCD